MRKNTLKFSILIIPTIIAFFNIIILLFPRDIILASKEGISLWFNNVFPSLVPFIIGTNILINLGVVSFIGTLLGPIMYPLFGVNGAGGFALITGMTSGYPMGAKTVATLREKNEITKTEAQRLISFTNNSGPLFILGAVGIGMFSSAEIGYFMMFVHYTSAIITGLLFKYYKKEDYKNNYLNKNIFKKAVKNMKNMREKDSRNFGQILGDSVKNSMETILVIGGFIILFCVIVKILEITNTILFIKTILINIFNLKNDNQLIDGLIIGAIEVTNGSKLISQPVYSKAQILIACAIISFGGLSIHAQAISFTSKTDINSLIYIFSKLIHSVISVLVGYITFPFIQFNLYNATSISISSNILLINKLIFSSILFIVSIFIIFLVIIIFNTFKLLYKKN